MSDQEKLIKGKYEPGETVVVYKSPSFIDGEVGTIVDVDKWSDKRTTYFICPLKDLGALEREAYKEGGDSMVDMNKMLNLSRWVKEDNLKRITFDKPTWKQKHFKSILFLLGYVLLALGAYLK